MNAVRKVSKYGDTLYLSVFSPNTRKYGPEKTPCLVTFYVVKGSLSQIFAGVLDLPLVWILMLTLHKSVLKFLKGALH